MRYVALDALRGICALLVVVFHIEIIGGVHSGIFHGSKLIEHSFLFVDFFFVLSGFVLTHAYLPKIGGRDDVAAFVIRRFGRVYPLHVLFLALFIVFELAKLYAISTGLSGRYPPFTGATSPFAALTNLTLVQALGIHDHATWNQPAWSISAEFCVYVIFAFCALLTRSSKRLFVLVSLVLAAVGALVVLLFSKYYIDTIYDYAIFRCLYGFFVGAVAYVVAAGLRGRIGGPRWSFLILELLAVGGCALFVHHTGTTPQSLAAPLVFAPAVILFSLEQGWLSASLLTTRPFRLLGEMSYAIYISHALILIAAARLFHVLRQKTPYIDVTRYVTDHYHDVALDLMTPTHPLASGAAAIGIVMAVLLASAASNRWIEAPCRTYFNGLAKRFARGPTPSRVAEPMGAPAG